MKKPWSPLLEHTLVYAAFQAPFAERKLAPLKRHNDLSAIRRVLDVGCGPGTNAGHFRGVDYLGLDINGHYVESARARYGMRFEVADVTTYRVEGEAFDFILANSFFHHVGEGDTDRILAHLATLLTEHGHVHILDLVLPERASPARFLARMDRGDHPRPLERWREMFGRHFDTEVFEPYDLGVPGIPLWKMVYFKGRARPS